MPEKDHEIEELKLRLQEAIFIIEDFMKWIGPPPTDKWSYDSLREDTWKRAKAFIGMFK